jgi:hypothetical protein
MTFRYVAALALLGWFAFIATPIPADEDEEGDSSPTEQAPTDADLYDSEGHRYHGEIEDGYGTFRTPDGRLRGSIDEDGNGMLRDDDGNAYRVRPR